MPNMRIIEKHEVQHITMSPSLLSSSSSSSSSLINNNITILNLVFLSLVL
jgi:hypothetical protein